jgi:hypothetical protein
MYKSLEPNILPIWIGEHESNRVGKSYNTRTLFIVEMSEKSETC